MRLAAGQSGTATAPQVRHFGCVYKLAVKCVWESCNVTTAVTVGCFGPVTTAASACCGNVSNTEAQAASMTDDLMISNIKMKQCYRTRFVSNCEYL